RKPQVEQQHPERQQQNADFEAHERGVDIHRRSIDATISRFRVRHLSALAFHCHRGWVIATFFAVGVVSVFPPAIFTIASALGLILLASIPGKTPKSSSAPSSSANGTLRQRFASCTPDHFSFNSPCRTQRTARSM